MSNASGLALSIRSSTESDTFDLAGQNATTIANTIAAAFSEPFPLHGEMVRITLITGAGKLGRQKYDESAAKTVTSTLRKLGYEDDSSASMCIECAGSFKLQHDTGKNLKTVVIFPNILSDAALEQGVSSINLTQTNNSLLPEGSPEHTSTVLSLDAFQKLVQTKCPSWSQKRECLHSLSNIAKTLSEVETKLLNGIALNDEEQDFYDSCNSLQEKENYLKKEMSMHVENGNITQYEKNKLMEQVDDKLESLDAEISQATKDKKPKKLQNLNNATEKLKNRRKMLYDIDPANPHKLKHEKEIMKLRKEIQPLIRLENSTKGRLLTLKETTSLARKTEILDEIQQLENSSQQWFEDDDTFQYRLKFHKDKMKVKEKEQQKKQVRKPPSSSSNSYKVNSTSRGGGGWGTAGTTRKKTQQPKKSSGSSVFSSMLMDSDSD